MTTNPAPVDRTARMEHIYRSYWRYTASQVRQLLRAADVQDVEDLVQAVMLNYWRWLETHPDPNHPAGLLRTIATHTVTDYYRRRARRPETPTSPDSTLWDAFQPADHADPPQSEALAAALATLPPTTAAAVQLREGHGLYGRQVAAILDCSKPHADRLTRAGLTALRAELQTA
jgi:RNA polymerase sigma factor (sigma-70 family)